MKKLFILFLMLTLTTGTGCATQVFRLKNDRTSELGDERMQIFVIGGIGQTQEVNAGKVCGGSTNVVGVEASESFLDWLISGITGGIITPRTARVYCSTESHKE